jgi:tungstate transport system ATP-binding protein
MSQVELRGVTKGFNGREVLRGLDLRVPRGKIYALVGPSGVGKTTTLRIVDLLEEPDGGEVRFAGEAVSSGGGDRLEIRRRMAMVMQQPTLLKRNVFANAAYGLRVRGVDEEEAERRVLLALEEVGIRDLAWESAGTLSGGEAQRLAFVRATVIRPELLLLDEFTANLDPRNVAMLEEAVRAFNERTGGTVLIVTHNLFQARRLAHRVGLLLRGRIVEEGSVESFFEDPSTPEARAFISGEMAY